MYSGIQYSEQNTFDTTIKLLWVFGKNGITKWFCFKDSVFFLHVTNENTKATEYIILIS